MTYEAKLFGVSLHMFLVLRLQTEHDLRTKQIIYFETILTSNL